MSNRNNLARISDIRGTTRVIKKIREKESRDNFRKIGTKAELSLVGQRDALFKYDEKAVRGVQLFLTNSTITTALAIH